MTPLLSVESVSKDFHTRGKRVLALDSLSMTVDEGEFVTVVGPSGCGKSTLLNLIVGLLQVSSGHILFRNRPINGINPEIGYITLVVIVVFFLTFFNTYSGVKGVDIELKNILRIMGASERQILFKVTVPGTIPWITTGLKLSVPYALVGAVVGEFIAASKGLGYLINYNTSLFSTTGAFGGILVLALIVVLCNEIIERTEAHLLRWRPREEVKGGRELY